YAGTCGGTAVATGASFTVSPATTTTYFVRSEGGSCGITACMSVTITVNTAPGIPQGIVLPATLCRNSAAVISILNPIAGVSYFWQLPNGWTITGGQGTAVLNILVGQGNGQIKVYAFNDCGNSKNYIRSVSPINCVRSTELSIEPLRIDLWPNPSSDIVHFAHGEIMPQSMVIYDTMGRVIYDGNWMNEMDVSALAGGIYFVRATSNGESVVKRMEVAR
ncbi:MAG: T9SS type A sorting domain-containing protein, partial [Flavobacteriales bacterium]